MFAVIAVALVAIGGRTPAKRHAERFVVAAHSVHVERISQAVYDDDDDGDDDEEIGLACPPIQPDDDDVSPQVATIADELPHSEIVEITFHPSDEGLGPAHGHSRKEIRPPRG